MLIFNGKKYFVPIFTGTGGDVLGADALPSQVIEGAKFVGKNGVVETGNIPKVAMAIPTVNVDADEEESEIIIVSINNQETGYAEKPPAPQSPPFTQSFVKLSIDGDTAIMECGDARIERKVGSTEEPTTSLVYTLSDNGAYYIVGTGFTSIEAIEADIGGGTEGSGLDSTWNGGRLVIPSEYNGKPVLAIAPRAFSGFYDITQVYIHDGITHFGHRCFNCPNSPWDTTMTSCRLPNTLVFMGGEDGRVFYGRQGLTSMAIPANVSELTRALFAYCNALTAAYTYNVKKLVRSCFQDCSALTTINADNMEEVGDVSFYNCAGLKEINLPKVETIGNNVFYNTSSLTKVTIGKNCRSIDTSGLRCGSTSNKCTFYFEGTTPPTIQSSTFETAKLNKIIVPQGCGNTYKTATNWVDFASYIQEEA